MSDDWLPQDPQVVAAFAIEFDETGQMLRLKNLAGETTTTMSVLVPSLLGHARAPLPSAIDPTLSNPSRKPEAK